MCLYNDEAAGAGEITDRILKGSKVLELVQHNNQVVIVGGIPVIADGNTVGTILLVHRLSEAGARVSARAGMQPRRRTESAFQPVGIQCLKFGNHKQSIFSDQAVVEPDFSTAPLRPLNKHKIPMYCGMIAVIAQRV